MRATITKREAAEKIVALLEDNLTNNRMEASIGLNDEGDIELFYNAHGYEGMQVEFAQTEGVDYLFDGDDPSLAETWYDHRERLIESFQKHWITDAIVDANYGHLTWKDEA